MQHIVHRDGDQLFTTSEIIASRAQVQHKNVLELIDRYQGDLGEFGQVAFETRPGYNNSQIRVAKLNEQQSTLLLTYLRNTPVVRQFKKDLVAGFFEMAQQIKELQQPNIPDHPTALRGWADELEARKAAEQRAYIAEDRIDTIEGGNGISVREFHKHYFSGTPERQFNELLYRKGLLLDQRGQRVDKYGNPKPGKQHRHPSAKGKHFFELDPHIDKETGGRYYNTKVRPGKPETDLVEQLERWGLVSNKNRRQAMLQVNERNLRAVV